jgi:hypothetical protein
MAACAPGRKQRHIRACEPCQSRSADRDPARRVATASRTRSAARVSACPDDTGSSVTNASRRQHRVRVVAPEKPPSTTIDADPNRVMIARWKPTSPASAVVEPEP